LAQMERIDDFLAYRDEVITRYDDQLKGLPGIVLPPRGTWAKNIFWLYSILIDDAVTGITRDNLMSQLSAYGIDTRPFFCPLHLQSPFASPAAGDFPNTEWLAAKGISLPTSNNISFEDVDKVCAAINSILDSSMVFREHDRRVQAGHLATREETDSP